MEVEIGRGKKARRAYIRSSKKFSAAPVRYREGCPFGRPPSPVYLGSALGTYAKGEGLWWPPPSTAS